MTAGTSAAEEASSPDRLGRATRFFFVLLVLVVGYVCYKEYFDSGYFGNITWWRLGTICLLLGPLIYVFFFLGSDYRRFGLFVYLNYFLTVIIASFLQKQITSNITIVRAVQNNSLLNYFCGGYFESVVCSLMLGLIAALLLTGIPLLIISYAASVYVLALHEIEGVSRWDALRYVITLILGINLPYMVIEDGQALVTKEAGKLPVIGGPGKLIIKHGNVVVLERGGKITRVLNAGVHKLKPLEKIRNIFVLGPVSNSATIEQVLTKDRIPLSITLGIKVQIEPASEVDKRPESRMAPHGEGLTEKLDDELYQVYEGTIRKAALMSQATSFAKRELKKCDEKQVCQDVEETTWNKVAASLPEGELRDHIMSHRFDELFDLVDSAPGEKPGVRVNKRKIYEIEQAILEEIKPTRSKVLGILVRGVDIGKIEFPESAAKLLLDRWWAPAVVSEAKARSAELEAKVTVTEARAKAQARILEGQGEAEARATFLREVLREMRREGALKEQDIVPALMQLINTMISREDLEAFVKAMTFLQRSSRGRLESGLEEANGNGKGEAEHFEW